MQEAFDAHLSTHTFFDLAAPSVGAVLMKALQVSTFDWLKACFPDVVVQNRAERGARVLEEVIELAQAMGTSRELAHRIVDRVFDNPPGEAEQEVGGAYVTLSVAASVLELDAQECWTKELHRIQGRIPEARARQALKVEQGITA